MSLWLKTDENLGGVGWKSEVNPGIMNSLGGIIVATLPFLVNPYLSKNYKSVKSSMILNLMPIPFLIVISCCNLLNGAVQWAVLVVCHGMLISLVTMGTSFISICVTNSLPTSTIGRGIGVSQTFASLARSITSTVSALIYGSLLSQHYSFPFDTHFLFILNCLILALNALLIKCFVSKSLEMRVDEFEKLNEVDTIEMKNISLASNK